jgi:hypothetical protein
MRKRIIGVVKSTKKAYQAGFAVTSLSYSVGVRLGSQHSTYYTDRLFPQSLSIKAESMHFNYTTVTPLQVLSNSSLTGHPAVPHTHELLAATSK